MPPSCRPSGGVRRQLKFLRAAAGSSVRSSPEDMQNIPGLIWDGGWASRLRLHLLWYHVTLNVPSDGILCVPEIWPDSPPPHPAVPLSILGTPPRASLGCGHPCRQSPGQLRWACEMAPSLQHCTAGDTCVLTGVSQLLCWTQVW